VTDPDPVAALAAQLEELRGQWARSQGEIGVLRERLEAESGQTMMLLLEVKHLREELAEAIEKRKLKPPPAPWWRVDREQGEAMLAELREWVETFLRPNYPDYLTRIPLCWPAHWAAIWELSTIRAEWIRVYGDEENRDLQGALAWHDRFLPGALGRLTAALAKCDEAGCQLARRRS
jgi:regulator of replication initiation timing